MACLGPFTLEVLETPTLGDRSYLVHDGTVAFVVDPQRDIDRVEALLDAHDVRLLAVFETHVHNDYLTGGHALAGRRGAAYLLNGDDDVAFERTPLGDGETVPVGDRMRVTALATPGHTFTHLAFALTDTDGDLGRALAVFSGGSLLFGATGRPDLLGAEHTDELAHSQHRSAHRLAALLPESAELLPTHGFGSFCAATQSGDATESTIGRELRTNPALTRSEQEYVDEIIGALDVWPAYYVHMPLANAAGPSAPDLGLPGRADAAELRRRLEAGEWVVDLRNRRTYAAGHLPGSYNFEVDGSFATYLGWLITWGTPVTLLGESADQVAEAQRELVRIGIDRPAAHATGTVEEWTDRPATFPTATFGELARVRHHRPVVVLDVRRDPEHTERHIEGAVHLPLHELLPRVEELPDGEVWVHCASGYRASIAASLLAAAGHRVVAVDDDFDNAAEAGLPVVGS
ncbi:MAG TPA: MBL fold metallo-hydrolase [Marmoricola sp.]|nr:MBL fold metallo-hydrolase [Marmoricola sp.]